MRITEPNEPINFSFEGAPMSGRAGEPIAAALMAAGIRVLRYTTGGEPRGLFCGVGLCGECAMVVDGVPGTLACQTPLAEDIEIERQMY